MTLCILPVIPSPVGDGASQRAWYILNALADAGPVDLVILQQTDRPELRTVPVDAARRVARTTRVVPVPSWCTTSAIVRHVPRSAGRVLDLARIGSVETPRLSRDALRQIASHLPEVVDTVFVGRLSTACIVDDLCRAGLFRARRRIVDFDDIMSQFRRLQVRQQAGRTDAFTRHWQSFIAARMEAAETRIARTWDACTVASADDARVLEATYRGIGVYHLPNVVDHVPVEGRLLQARDREAIC